MSGVVRSYVTYFTAVPIATIPVATGDTAITLASKSLPTPVRKASRRAKNKGN